MPPPTPTHAIQIDGELVPYRLNRNAKRLSLRIDARGLRVAAPPNIALPTIEDFIQRHGQWVRRKLNERLPPHAQPILCIEDGVRLVVLGRETTIRILPGANRSRWLADTLILEARRDADLASLAQRALHKQALRHFQHRLADYCARLAVPTPKLGLSSAQTRWGSCSLVGGIRLNWRLIFLPLSLSDYVVAHEVAHLLEMNHGPRFWATVASIHPPWEAARRQLKAHTAAFPRLTGGATHSPHRTPGE
ncbi:MAG TPA: SprT family zinc-dependent metalloprotease [Rhodocyclaceae bacterium]|nr:SprT family zinc-dependent metalloprotease [Rhodocyclaceae bacterium]